MSETWLGCPNCVLAFSSEGEYRRHFESNHPRRKFKTAELLKSQGSQF